MEAWYEIIMKSKSPVPNTPLSPFMPLGFVLEHGYRLDGDKFKRVSRVYYYFTVSNES